MLLNIGLCYTYPAPPPMQLQPRHQLHELSANPRGSLENIQSDSTAISYSSLGWLNTARPVQRMTEAKRALAHPIYVHGDEGVFQGDLLHPFQHQCIALQVPFCMHSRGLHGIRHRWQKLQEHLVEKLGALCRS